MQTLADCYSARATRLADWVSYGRLADAPRRIVRGWMNADRGHVPVIDRR